MPIEKNLTDDDNNSDESSGDEELMKNITAPPPAKVKKPRSQAQIDALKRTQEARRKKTELKKAEKVIEKAQQQRIN